MQFVYAAALTRTGPRELVVSFRDLPECLTSGEDPDMALAAAADALAEALASRIDDGETIPHPSGAAPGEHEVAVPTLAFRDSGLTRAAFAASLGVSEKVVRRLLDPRHRTFPDRVGIALRALGQRIAIDVRAA